MTYREILELYKQGKLAEEKQKEVEADIEKQDAISEYLFEEADIPGMDAFDERDAKSEGMKPEQEELFLKMVDQSIRRAFIKMGTAVGTIVLAFVLLLVFAFPRFVSLFYYNPGKIVGENDFGKTNQISLDMAVYTELFVPGYYRNQVEVDDLGYGKYNICINQTTTMTDFFTNLSGTIKRNNMTLYDTNIIKRPVDNAFIRTEATKDLPLCLSENEEIGETEPMGAAGTVKEAKDKLQELDEKDNYIAYVTLNRLTDYEEFIQWFQSMDLMLGEPWCSVYPEGPHGGLIAHNIGFKLYQDGFYMCYDEQKYPNLCQQDPSVEISPKEEAQRHFLSMLQYMSRQKAFLKMMDQEDSIDYAAIMEAVKRDGIRLNGFAVVAQKEELLALSEEEEVYYIYTVPMR